uniref:Uncharacterized protein n=1 Tax=Periophthalmus magnuspinnatus TaxID=409849 RepID=A0A3B3ZJH1_9GOBI
MDPPENQAGAEVSDVDREETPSPAEVLSAAVLLGAGATAIQHPVIYIKLVNLFVLQVGHEPLPPTWGTTLFGRKVLYLPGLFSYGEHVFVYACLCDRNLMYICGRMLHVCVVKCYYMCLTNIWLCVSQHSTSSRWMVNVACLEACPLTLFAVLCMVQIFKEEGLAGFYVGLVPHVLGELLYLWGYNLLCHFINTYAEDDTVRFRFSLLYPFTLVADLMALNDCGLAAGLPPYSPVFKSWLHCWSHLRSQGNLFRGSSLFFRRVPASVIAAVEL